MQDPEKFDYDLERPMTPVGRAYSADELAADGEAFVAFAEAFGVAPPTDTDSGGFPALPSGPSL